MDLRWQREELIIQEPRMCREKKKLFRITLRQVPYQSNRVTLCVRSRARDVTVSSRELWCGLLFTDR